MGDTSEEKPTNTLSEREALIEEAMLTLDEQRDLILQLAPRVLAQLPEEERDDFLRELHENLMLGRVSGRHAPQGDSNPEAWEVPRSQ